MIRFSEGDGFEGVDGRLYIWRIKGKHTENGLSGKPMRYVLECEGLDVEGRKIVLGELEITKECYDCEKTRIGSIIPVKEFGGLQDRPKYMPLPIVFAGNGRQLAS
jgi:hypothetical protein